NQPGLTDYRPRLGSEGEVRLLLIGSYCFAGSVHEITLHPRPASRGRTGDVETDHPHVAPRRSEPVRRAVVARCGVSKSRIPRVQHSVSAALQDTTDRTSLSFH